MAGDKRQSWSTSSRDRLRSKYIRIIQTLGYYLEEAGKIKSAIECFQKGIEADNLAEEFYQQLMLCLKLLGRNTEAVAVYHRCQKNLSASLGIKPSHETQSIYKSLLKDIST